MHLAYSAISTTNGNETVTKERPGQQLMLKYLAYQATCEKYSREIAAIQKYLPGWIPRPPTSA